VGAARPAVGRARGNWVEGVKTGRNRAPCAWKEPVFSTGTDAMRRLPVAARLTDWQAETYE